MLYIVSNIYGYIVNPFNILIFIFHEKLFCTVNVKSKQYLIVDTIDSIAKVIPSNDISRLPTSAK